MESLIFIDKGKNKHFGEKTTMKNNSVKANGYRCKKEDKHYEKGKSK